MKTKTIILLSALLLTTVVLFFACKDLDLTSEMAVKTDNINGITTEQANVVGEVIDLGEGMNDHGVFYATSPNAQNGERVSIGAPGAASSYTVELYNLEHNTLYYARAYGFNGNQYAYGDEKTFTTLAKTVPDIELIGVSNISGDSATFSLRVTSLGYEVESILSCGFYYSLNENFNDTETINLGSLSNLTTIDTIVHNLLLGQKYFVKAFATNLIGATETNTKSFTTKLMLPSVITDTIINIDGNSALGGGTVTSDGGASITVRGVCWSTHTNPTTDDLHSSNGSSTGTFTSSINNLKAGTRYYVRAYATNSVGTAYGDQRDFETSTTIPSVTINNVENILARGATVSGDVTQSGGSTVVNRGFCWGIQHNPDLAGAHSLNGIGNGEFSHTISALDTSTTYYLRAYATNSKGTAYSKEESFKTKSGIPILTTANVTDIGATSATCGGNISSDGGDNIIARGVCWSTSQKPTIENDTSLNGKGIGSFVSSITKLSPNQDYYVRAYATNGITTAYGDQKTIGTGESTVAGFVANKTDVSIGDNIQFTDQSTNSPTSWSWDFGDGNSSTLQNPTHSFSDAGAYTIILTAANAYGNDDETKTDYITVGEAPVAAFNADDTDVAINTSITFTDQSTNSPTSWAWDFGDGTTSTSQNPTHSYSAVGTYTVSLTATNAYGNDVITKTNYITVGKAPIAAFNADDTDVAVGTTITFTDQSSNSPTSWAWDFGDGTTSTVQNPTHSYSAAGTYAVSLTTTNAYGNDDETKTNYITVGGAPVAAFNADTTDVAVSATITFSDQSTGSPTSWSWDFGDGNSSTLQNPTHNYSTAGTYTVSLTASNTYGNDIITKTNYITIGEAPVAAFSADETDVEVGTTITFTDESTGSPTSWEWDFGDGSTSSLQNPTHNYLTTGTYTVILTATNTYGNDDETKTDFIIISPNIIYGSVIDYDGNSYKTVNIGTQTWMAENLKTTHYSDGTEIDIVESTSIWDNLSFTEAAYCYYDNSVVNANIYGALYTWSATMKSSASSTSNPSGVQGVCPSGWHVPSEAEMLILATLIGDNNSGKLKEVGTSHWIAPNSDATNETGFTGLPSGSRGTTGNFVQLGERLRIWSTTEKDSDNAYLRYLSSGNNDFDSNYLKKSNGLSVRCIKD